MTLLLAVMVVFGALTARARATRVPHAFWPLLFALTIAATATLALVLALGVFPVDARYLVPVGGMVIGNAMTASATRSKTTPHASKPPSRSVPPPPRRSSPSRAAACVRG